MVWNSGFYRFTKSHPRYILYMWNKINLNQIQIYVQRYVPAYNILTVYWSSTSKPISLNDPRNISKTYCTIYATVIYITVVRLRICIFSLDIQEIDPNAHFNTTFFTMRNTCIRVYFYLYCIFVVE